MIRSCGDALLNVLNDILDYSKMQAGRLEVENIDFNMMELVDSCTDLFAAKMMTRDYSGYALKYRIVALVLHQNSSPCSSPLLVKPKAQPHVALVAPV